MTRAVLAGALALVATTGLGNPALRHELIERSLAALHEEDMDGALRACAELRRLEPDDPIGDLLAANVYQTRMRDYRVRSFEREFASALARALALAEKRVRTAPSAEAFFIRGSARGYRAIHRFSEGDWLPALSDAMRANGDMKRAWRLEPAFLDPLLALALYDFWKSEKLSLGLGLFSGGRKKTVPRLESVWREGRYLRVEAAYALQTVHLRERRYTQALEVNTWLHERYPRNPVGLYHRALILEGLERHEDALTAWAALAERVASQPRPSDGFLAECHLHRARLHRRLAAEARQPDRRREAEEALASARRHAARRDRRRELEGPFERFGHIEKAIDRLTREFARDAGEPP